MAIDLVTGAGGNSGSYIAQRLLQNGRQVRTITRNPEAIADPIEAFPYAFSDPDLLAAAFKGVDTFYNTYWERHPAAHGGHDIAVARSSALISAAAAAGVRRIVQVSVMHPALDSPYSYHRGKAEMEELVRSSGLSYAIVRPAVMFGGKEVLLNNIAWLLRRLHVFTVPGDGKYPIRPTHVEDVADLMVRLASSNEDGVHDAGGPETFEFGTLIRRIRDAIGVRAAVVNAPRGLVLPLTKSLRFLAPEAPVDAEELDSLIKGLVSCDGPAIGNRRYTDYLSQVSSDYGREYVR
ncbi:NAD(P)H-binding protein [Leucobacter viscericola]|uniref:NAD(P)H-binding protein n=1 Tax=Leucobacter viscericola TaxID=2714935 RepID=A0A6G7XEC6_9MICO|nr:NAD(P)H-binding protein [Leucobacter viscericola]QIK62728.1 NAD(P)H-binding protein [Leucobacter viscericola]